MCFTNCDNHTNEITIARIFAPLRYLLLEILATCYLDKAALRYLHQKLALENCCQINLLHITCFISQFLSYSNLLLCIKGHIRGLYGFREQIVQLQLLVGSTLKYLSNCATVIPCSWGLSQTRVENVFACELNSKQEIK